MIQDSIVDHRKFRESNRHEGSEDVAVECDEAKEYSSFGKAVIPMNEISVFHLYCARELMMKSLEEKYEEEAILGKLSHIVAVYDIVKRLNQLCQHHWRGKVHWMLPHLFCLEYIVLSP